MMVAALARLSAKEKSVNVTEYDDAACTSVKRVQTFSLNKCAAGINRLATCDGGVANVTWFTNPGCKGAINDTYAYPVSTCVKGDKKHSYEAVCF